MRRKITIDPVTRLEGHGRIEVLLNEQGDVDRAYFQIPELRGFEKFVEGRPVEEMPQITSRICGVCPMAHHMAATRALDDLYGIEPPAAAKAIRQLAYNLFMFEDHALHFFFLGGPDFLVGPETPREQRNILGVLGALGMEVGRKVIAIRRQARELMAAICGKATHPVFGLPGGVSRAMSSEERQQAVAFAGEAIEFALSVLRIFEEKVVGAGGYLDAIRSEDYTHRTYCMGLVDAANRSTFYEGAVRVVDPEGREYVRFRPREYVKHIAEHVESWTFVKFCYLRNIGWKGFQDGQESGVYSVAPLARLNVSDALPTPRAQEARERFFDLLGGRPVHHTLANHWARVIELVMAAELIQRWAGAAELTDTHIRNLPTARPTEGVGVVEAPRGTLIHHYATDARGVVTRANLIVATQNNAARIAMSVDRAAKALIRKGEVNEGILNRIEMAFRAYDPCNGCATHALPGQMPLTVRVRGTDGAVVREVRREGSR